MKFQGDIQFCFVLHSEVSKAQKTKKIHQLNMLNFICDHFIFSDLDFISGNSKFYLKYIFLEIPNLALIIYERLLDYYSRKEKNQYKILLSLLFLYQFQFSLYVDII